MSQDLSHSETRATLHALSDGGTMGRLIRAHPWEKTALGPISSWPQSLITTVSICLKSRFPMLVWWGPDLTMIYNDAYIPIPGAKHPDCLGRPGRVVWPEVWDIIGPMLQGVITRGEATWSEDIMLPLDRKGFAEECYFTFSYSPIHDESGGIGGVFTAVSETTAKVIGERRLHLLRELGEKTATARNVEEVAALSAEILGRFPADVPFARLYLADADPKTARLQGCAGLASAAPFSLESIDLTGRVPPDPWGVARVIRSGREELLEGLYPQLESIPRALVLPLGQDAARGALVAGLSPRLELDANYRGFFALLASQLSTALAKAHAYEEERKRAEALAELDRAKTTFFGNASHELRTPLTLMLGPIEELLGGAGRHGLAPEDREKLELTHRNGLRLLKLVNSLLDFSRIEAGRMKAQFRPTELARLTAELASVFRSTIEGAGLTLTLDTRDIGAPVYVDREMWEKIVFNLLSNAFKFTLRGGITVGLHPRDGRVLFTVRDTGTGIPEAELPRLFERFHRAESTQGRTYEGTGIGLALTQELVKLHGGSIQVRSAWGVGTEFTVELPLGRTHLPPEQVVEGQAASTSGRIGSAFVEEAARWLPDAPAQARSWGLAAPAPESGPRLEAGPADHPEGSKARARILLADDNADMRAYVKGLLSDMWEVDTVADGEEALRAARASPPDLFLGDVMMPRLDGFALTRALRAEPATRTVPIILLSARAGEESRIEGLAAGADDYLTKPFSARELVARVSTHLAIAQVRRETQEQLADLLRREQEAHRLAEFSREELHSFFMQAPAPMCILSGPDHVFTLVNPLYEKFVGGRELLGRSVREAFSPEETELYLDILDRVFQTGQPHHGQEMLFRLQSPDGGWKDHFLNFIYQPFRGMGGGVRGILAFVHDVTEQVEARRKVEKLADELQGAVYSRDEFLSIASHELKTPITSLKLQLQLTRRRIHPELQQAPVPDKLRGMVEAGLRQLDRLTRLIEDLLDVSRIRAGKLGFSFEEFPLEELLSEVVERFIDQLAEVGCRIELELEPGLRVVWDRPRVEQVLVNLISNAIKYAPGQLIRVSARREHERARLTVQDFGPGIPKERQARIFERFERATSARNISGLGLGLFIVSEIVKGHCGTIWVESEEGQGASFIIDLPLRPAGLGQHPGSGAGIAS